jgi:ketosteroid isomerase-like protein
MSNSDSHRRSADMFNSRDWDGFAAQLAEDCELVDQARNVTVKGRQQYVELEQGWVAAFSDARITSPRFLDAGSATVMLFTGVGHNDGQFGPFPPTGREAPSPFCEVREYDADGKAVRAEWYYDQLSMLTRLGHIQPPE